MWDGRRKVCSEEVGRDSDSDGVRDGGMDVRKEGTDGFNRLKSIPSTQHQ